MRFIFTCGGTGGHINPALAVARLVKERKPGAEILFIGVEGGMETRLVPQAGFEIKTLCAESISRKKSLSGVIHNIRAIIKNERAVATAGKLIDEFRPDIIFGTGGYASFPVLRAASKRKNIKTFIHESNAFPGLVTRVLGAKIDKVLLNFEASREHLDKKANSAVVGNPIRGDILMYDRKVAREELGVGDTPLLVSFWGSLGAREMNKKIAEVMKIECEKGDGFFHIHASGSFGYEWMPDYLKELGVNIDGNEKITLREYIDDMPRVLSAADVVMCRGGAGTLSEIIALGKPAIIVPSPNVTDNHQYKNALELQKVGGAVLIEESKASAETLYNEAKTLLYDKEKREKMSKSLSSISVLDGAERIYEEIMR